MINWNKYAKQKKWLSKLIAWLDENEIELKDLCKEDLELYFRASKQARKTGTQIKTCLKQVLDGEGLQSEWVQTVIVPFSELYYSLDDVLKTVDDYANGYGRERYKIEPAGFDSVKAAIIVLWLGISPKDAGYVLNEDVYEDRIVFVGTTYPYIGNISDFMVKYKKSDGYFSGERPNLRFKVYKDTEYFIRTIKTASRDKIVGRLFEKIVDLDINKNDILKAGLFDRVYRLGNELLIGDNLMSEYRDYQKKRMAYDKGV